MIGRFLGRLKGRLQELGMLPEPKEPPERDPLARVWEDPKGFRGFLVTVQNGPIVNRYLAAAFSLFLIAGIEALVMRSQLATPNSELISAQHFNRLFTMHGSIMMFLVTVPIMEGLASFALPLLLGARELPFPRMTAFGLWTFVFGALLLYSSRLFGQVPEVGWTAYTPLSGMQFSPDLGVDFWLLGLSVAEVAAIGTGIELIIAVLKMRAPGMTVRRMPIYLWSILAMAYAMLFGFTPLLVATTLLEMDRKLGTRFFDDLAGGNALLWQHLFWIFGHPDVYIQFLPATGIVSLIVPAFIGRRLMGEGLIVAAIIATGMISFGLWVHHMFTAGLSVLGMSFFAAASMLIAIPSGIQVAAWIASMWKGRPVYSTAFLFCLGFLVTFVMGGVTGVMVAAIPFDWQVHDTQFVVGHFHYVLVGGVIFPIFAAFYYWLPKMVGRMLDERLGKWNFWLMFVGFQLTFFPLHVSGLLGMPRRVYTYLPGLGWELPNLVSFVGVWVLGLGVAVFVVNVFACAVFLKGKQPTDNPWNAGTLDWATATPPPDEGYRVPPLVHSRYPLWDQARLDQGESRHERIVRGLEQAPTAWRGQVITSVVTAEPQAIVRLAHPSIWPFLTSIALTLNFVATLFDLYWLLLGATLATAAGTVGWLWPSREERERRLAGDGDTLHGLPVYTSGTSAPAWWTMAHIILVIVVALACLLFCYFYLRAAAPQWPPAGVARPMLLLPGLATLALAGTVAAAWWAERGVRPGHQGRLKLGLAAAFGGQCAALALLVLDWIGSGLSHTAHSYGSLVLALLGYQGTLLVIGLVLTGTVLVQALLGYFDHRRFLAVQNTAFYGAALLACWLALGAVVYLSPYV